MKKLSPSNIKDDINCITKIIDSKANNVDVKAFDLTLTKRFTTATLTALHTGASQLSAVPLLCARPSLTNHLVLVILLSLFRYHCVV